MGKKFLFTSVLLVAGLFFCANAMATSSSLGSLQESIEVGRVLSIGLNSSNSGNWYLFSNSDSAVAGYKLSSGSLIITGQALGSTVISVCTDNQGNNCMQVTVSVTPAVAGKGEVLGASTIKPHAYKSWVLQGKTVFYVDSNGLIPITTWKIFLSNGGKQSLIQPANSGDLSLPLEAFMTLHDPRVKK